MNDTNTTNIVNIINTYPNYVQSLMIASICLSPCIFCGFCCLICCLTVRFNDHIRSNNNRIRIEKNYIELLNKTTKLLNIIELTDVKIIKECSICIDDYKIGNILRQLKCSHTFHQECIDKWLIHNNICPNCRVVVY